MLLLVVDDEVIIADGMAAALRGEQIGNLEIVRFFSAREALDFALKNRVDILLTDISMPQMDGFELYNAVRGRWPDCRVIFLTGFQTFDYAYKAIQYPNVRYVVKAEGVDRVLRLVRETAGELQASKPSGSFQNWQEAAAYLKEVELQIAENMEVREDARFAEVSGREALKEEERITVKEEELKKDAAELIALRIEERIREYPGRNLSVSELAEELFFSADYLSRLYRQARGTSLSAFLTEQKMELAKELLAKPGVRIQEIAGRLGYSTPANFIRSFKKLTGITPNEYRRSAGSRQT